MDVLMDADELAGGQPVEITPELLASIVKQVEFYFSDQNLATDRKLQKLIRKADGLVPVKLFTNFRKVRALTKDVAVITEALRCSTTLRLSADESMVRRLVAVPDYDVVDIQRRTIIVEHLPPTPSIESVTELFSAYGQVNLVRIVSKETKGKLPCWLTAATHSIHQQHAFVEFCDPDSAILAVAALHESDGWGSTATVRHLLVAPSDKDGRFAPSPLPWSLRALATADSGGSFSRRSSGGGSSTNTPTWGGSGGASPGGTACSVAAATALLRRSSIDGMFASAAASPTAFSPSGRRSLEDAFASAASSPLAMSRASSASALPRPGPRPPAAPSRPSDPSSSSSSSWFATAAAAAGAPDFSRPSSAADLLAGTSFSSAAAGMPGILQGLRMRPAAPPTPSRHHLATASDWSHPSSPCCAHHQQPRSPALSNLLRSSADGSSNWHSSPAPTEVYAPAGHNHHHHAHHTSTASAATSEQASPAPLSAARGTPPRSVGLWPGDASASAPSSAVSPGWSPSTPPAAVAAHIFNAATAAAQQAVSAALAFLVVAEEQPESPAGGAGATMQRHAAPPPCPAPRPPALSTPRDIACALPLGASPRSHSQTGHDPAIPTPVRRVSTEGAAAASGRRFGSEGGGGGPLSPQPRTPTGRRESSQMGEAAWTPPAATAPWTPPALTVKPGQWTGGTRGADAAMPASSVSGGSTGPSLASSVLRLSVGEPAHGSPHHPASSSFMSPRPGGGGSPRHTSGRNALSSPRRSGRGGAAVAGSPRRSGGGVSAFGSPRQADGSAGGSFASSPRLADGGGRAAAGPLRRPAAARGKKDYAAWAAATPEFRNEATQLQHATGSAHSVGFEVVSAVAGVAHAADLVAHMARGPDGSRGFHGRQHGDGGVAVAL